MSAAVIRPPVPFARPWLLAATPATTPPPARCYWHERGRVLSSGAPPQIMAADQVKTRVTYLLDKVDMATDFRDGDLAYDMATQLLHLLEARREAERWRDAHGVTA